MTIVFFLAFFLLSYLPFLYSDTDYNTSTPTCPKSFSCQDYRKFEYPLYSGTDMRCGLIKVNCTKNGGEIQVGNQSYEIRENVGHGTSFLVHNRTFEKLVKKERCEALTNNFTSPSPLLYSISIEPFTTLFKCTNNLNYTEEIDAYFNKLIYYRYNRCKDHNFYYKNSTSTTEVPNDLPQRCEVIWLPVESPDSGNRMDYTNIFSLLSYRFYISFLLSSSCDECHIKEGRCENHDGKFQCLDAKKEKQDEKPILIPEKQDKKPILIPEKQDKKPILIPALTTSVVTIVIVILLCLRRKLTWRINTKNHVNVERFLKNHESLAPKRYSYSHVKKMTNSFKVKLGQGGFGSVYKGALSNGNLVAVKVLTELKGDGEDFINEVASVGRTSHVNIVSLVGFCFEGRQRALIYEFMPNGSLERFIYDRDSSNNSQLGWDKLHQIAIGIARGLEYFHSGCNTRILHFDIKPHNILLNLDFCPKISDFGLAKLFPEKQSMISMSHMRGTPGYIAPELFSRNFGVVSHKSDVYSYGMMILEMVGGRKNVEVQVDHTSEIYFPHWIYKKVEIDEELGLHGIVSDKENTTARKMIIVGLWCIQTNPLNRPTITKVLEMLEGDLELLEIPPKPYLSSPPRLVISSTID